VVVTAGSAGAVPAPPQLGLHDVRTAERELCRIPAIRAARIVTGADHQPVEVHVLAVPGRFPKQVVRDVQSVVVATLGLELDDRIIQVVQMEDPSATGARIPQHPSAPSPDRGSGPEGWSPAAGAEEAGPGGRDTAGGGAERLLVEGVHVLRHLQRCSAEVTLRRGGRLTTGTSDGVAASSAVRRLVSEATVEALRGQLAEAGQLTVETTAVVQVGDRPVAVVTLLLVGAAREDLLTGSAPVRGTGDHDAVARAVLDAVNRRLTPLE
jgi:hypothetical protein